MTFGLDLALFGDIDAQETIRITEALDEDLRAHIDRVGQDFFLRDL